MNEYITRERAKELYPIIQAYANGATIQFLSRQQKENDEWIDVWYDCLDFFKEPTFSNNVKYRIKPIETKYENDKELPDCKFNYRHLENGEWIKKKCHVNCECEFATFGICNDDMSDLKVE